MRLYTCMCGGRVIVAAEKNNAFYEVVNANCMLDLIKSGESAQIGAQIQPSEILSPIPKPYQDIICLGLNYSDHLEESNRFKKGEFEKGDNCAVYFSKRVNEATSPFGIIPSHDDIVDSLDYEAELAVIIGKRASKVKQEDAFDYVFGYSILNDVSARNVQMAHKQWFLGKSLDGFTPIGPCIVTADEFSVPLELDIRSYVNGELRQNSNTANMIFGVDYVISELSQGMTLEAGTIISMGTPSGVGMGFVPPVFLNKGDVVKCEIEGIGYIENTVK